MAIKNDKLILAARINSGLATNSGEKQSKALKLSHAIRPDQRGNGVRSVNVTPDGKFLIITFENSTQRISVVDLEKLEYLPHSFSGHTASVRITSVTSDSREFYTASWDGSSRRFEIESGRCTRILSGFGRSPSCFLHPDQKLLFTASYDSDCELDSRNNGRCWDISSGKVLRLYKHTDDRVSPEAVDIAYNDGKVYTGSDDGCAYQWNLRGSQPLKKYFTFKGTVRKLAITDKFMAAACTDGFVRVHYKLSGETYMYFPHCEPDVREVRISKDETRLWSATEGGMVRCFNLVTGELIYDEMAHKSWIWSICLLKDEKILVTGSGDGSVAFLKADTGRVLARLWNLTGTRDFLITSPPDKAFPHGFFYSSNTDLIQVVSEDEETGIRINLGLNDPEREAYINKHNLKNLIITRLKNEKQYNSITENYMQDKKILDQIKKQELPRMLRS